MSSIVTGICNGFRIAYESFAIKQNIDKLKKTTHPNDSQILRLASIGTQFILLGLFTSELAAINQGATNTTLSRIKIVEIIVRVIVLPIKIVEVREAIGEAEKTFTMDQFTMAQALNLMDPLLKLWKASDEYRFYKKKILLEMSPE